MVARRGAGGVQRPAREAAGLDGSPVKVSFEGDARKKVLLFFSPSCPYCREQVGTHPLRRRCRKPLTQRVKFE